MEATGGEHPPRDVGEVAVRGSQVANQIVYESGRMIGGVLAGLVNLYNPEAIFIGGGARKISLVLFHHPASHPTRATVLFTRSLGIDYSGLVMMLLRMEQFDWQMSMSLHRSSS